MFFYLIDLNGYFIILERTRGIEPPSHAWQARIIATIRRPRSLIQECHFLKKIISKKLQHIY